MVEKKLIILLVLSYLFFNFLPCFAQCPEPQAKIDPPEKRGTLGEYVCFSDDSTGDIIDWRWTYEHDSTVIKTSESQEDFCVALPVTSFPLEPPTNTKVTLTVKDSCGNTATTEAPILQGSQVWLVSSGTVKNAITGLGIAGAEVSAGPGIGTLSGPDGHYSLRVRLSEGATLSASAPCYYSQAINITGSTSHRVDFNLTPRPPPEASFTASQTWGNAPLTVIFYDNSTNDPRSRRWSFGDGGSSTKRNPSHVYETSGTFTVSLTVSSYCGSDTETKVAYITVSEAVEPVPSPTADFTATRLSGTAPLTVSFTDLSSGWLTSWLWNFGDGETSTSQHTSHTYADVGTYTVSLKSSNENSSDTETKANFINVLAHAPLAGFTFSPTSGNAPLTVEFTDSSINSPTSWSWDFGDGKTSNEQNPAHVYTSAGTYTVALMVSNAAGSDTETKTGCVSVYLPAGSAPLNPTIVNIEPPCSPGRSSAFSPDATITVNANQSGSYFRYWVNDNSYCIEGEANWVLLLDWTTDTTITWTPAGNGRKTVIVWVTDDISNDCPGMVGVSYEVGSSNCIDPVSINVVPANGNVNEEVTITAIGARENLYYRFYVNSSSYCTSPDNPDWEQLQDWSFANTCRWTPAVPGEYTLIVWTSVDTNNPCTGMAGMSYKAD